MLEFIEEALGEVAFAVARNRSHSVLPFAFGGITEVIFPSVRMSIIGSASKALSAIKASGSAYLNRFRASQIIGLPWREYHLDGVAKSIDSAVDFRCQSAARAADRLRAVFFRAPALGW